MELFDLKKNTTKDGSLSLYSLIYDEGFHDTDGALKESIDKYLSPAQLELYAHQEKIVVLDVCMGMGYNSGSILEKILQNKQRIEWHGLEIDQRPLSFGLNEEIFKNIWSSEVQHFFYCLEKIGKWNKNFSEGTIHWGDARQKIFQIKKSQRFDLILLDPFSPQKCPELWSHQFISLLAEKLSFNGRLITYSTAASVRMSLKKAGLKIYSIRPKGEDQTKWSMGTVALKKQLDKEFISKNRQLNNLSKMELEHLETRSSIPYRDPTGKGNSKEIITTREIEQSKSQLTNTSSWRKRWNTAQ